MTQIAFHHVTKRYGAGRRGPHRTGTVTALDDFSVEIAPGRITAFLGANGSGKTTSMRVLVGLTAPTAGSAVIGGRRYRDIPHPTRVVGAVLDQGFQPNRSARAHTRIVAAQAGMPLDRADAVLELVGLTQAARRRVGGFSLGMRQRLALACALVGDPSVLVLDEPFNGLDPEGIWTMRSFLRGFADAGGTVFLSSHLLSEVAHSADDAVVIHRGSLVQAGPVAALASGGPAPVVVTTPDADALAVALTRRGGSVRRTGPTEVTVEGLGTEDVGRTAVAVGAAITGMTRRDDLESVFAGLIHPRTSEHHTTIQQPIVQQTSSDVVVQEVSR